MNIPVSVSYSYINKQISQFLDGTLYHDDSFEDNDGDNIKATVTLKNSPKISGKGNDVFLNVPLHIKGEIANMFLNQKFDCDVYLKIVSSLEITPNWKIKSKTQLKEITVENAPIVKIGFFQIDSKGVLEKVARSYAKDILSNFDSEVYQSPDLKNEMQRIYTQLHQAISLTDSSFLYLQIEDVTGSSISSSKENFDVYFGFKGKVYLDSKIQQIPEKTLIPFRKEESKSKDYKIIILQKSDSLNWQQQFNLEFNKKTYRTSKRNSFTVDSTSFFEYDKKIILEHYISGNVNGKIQTILELTYDSLSQCFKTHLADFTPSSLNEINQKAPWILDCNFKNDLENYFEKMSTLKTSFLELNLSNIIQQQLNDPHVKVQQTPFLKNEKDFILQNNTLHLTETYSGEIQIQVK